MRLAITCILLCNLIFLSGCNTREGLLTRVWFFTYEKKGRDVKSTDPELSPVSFINLQSKGKYTANLNGFEHGQWSLEDKVLMLKPTGGKSRKVLLRRLTDKECVMDLDPSNQYMSHSVFEGFKNPLDDEESPFSIANNKWRVKATNKESAQQITDRLVNHFMYWESYFKWGIENNRSTLDVRSHPSPLKIYGNGFTLMPVSEWPEEWSRNFYDDEDRQIAFDKIFWTLRNKTVQWPQSVHKFKQFVSAFQQMEANIRYAE